MASNLVGGAFDRFRAARIASASVSRARFNSNAYNQSDDQPMVVPKSCWIRERDRTHGVPRQMPLKRYTCSEPAEFTQADLFEVKDAAGVVGLDGDGSAVESISRLPRWAVFGGIAGALAHAIGATPTRLRMVLPAIVIGAYFLLLLVLALLHSR